MFSNKIETQASSIVVLNLFKVVTHILRGKKLATHLGYPTYKKTTVLCKQVPNYMNQMLIAKDENYLATNLKKLAKHKCLATPWLSTCGLVNT
jgi:hypothetical protein